MAINQRRVRYTSPSCFQDVHSTSIPVGKQVYRENRQHKACDHHENKRCVLVEYVHPIHKGPHASEYKNGRQYENYFPHYMLSGFHKKCMRLILLDFFLLPIATSADKLFISHAVVHGMKNVPSWKPSVCVLCGGCAAVCPVGAVSLTPEEVIIDIEACTGCDTCVDICPMRALETGGDSHGE